MLCFKLLTEFQLKTNTEFSLQINWEEITQIPIGVGLGNYLGDNSFYACPTSKACPSTCPQNNCWNNKHCQIFDKGMSGE